MKMNRKTMLIAAFAVAVVALAGVGYAASVAFFGKTTTSTESLNAGYVNVSLTEYGAQTFPLYYNSINSGSAEQTSFTYEVVNGQVFDINTINVSAVGLTNPTLKLTIKANDASITGLTAQTGCSYSWKISFDGTEYVDYADETGVTLTNDAATIYLRLIVNHSDAAAPSPPAQVVIPALSVIIDGTDNPQ